jgi:SAM-dependent methyltransferase
VLTTARHPTSVHFISYGRGNDNLSSFKPMNRLVNPFFGAEQALHYHEFRPHYHHIPLAKLRQTIGREPRKALDVACGTGHSTVELAKICAFAVGCDTSRAMLREATHRSPALNFVQAAAESLPFASGAFDLVNISWPFIGSTKKLSFAKHSDCCVREPI